MPEADDGFLGFSAHGREDDAEGWVKKTLVARK
jgi:hypothetical protein